MAAYWVWTCPQGRSVAADSLTKERPQCNTGQGDYQFVELEPLPDVAAQLALIGVDAPTIATVFTIGLGLYAGFWAMGWATKAGIDAIRRL